MLSTVPVTTFRFLPFIDTCQDNCMQQHPASIQVLNQLNATTQSPQRKIVINLLVIFNQYIDRDHLSIILLKTFINFALKIFRAVFHAHVWLKVYFVFKHCLNLKCLIFWHQSLFFPHFTYSASSRRSLCDDQPLSPVNIGVSTAML